MSEPPPVATVEGIAYADRVSVLVGESGAGKSFVLLSVVGAITSGVPWHGRRVRAGSVAYVSFEGDALGLRLRALHRQGHRLEYLHVLRASEPLSPTTDRDRLELPARGEIAVAADLDALADALAGAGQPPIVLVAIDTVRASLAGSEDNSGDVSGYLRAVRRLLSRVPGAACVLVHHAGWQDGETRRQRERGSSAWRGNVDCTLYLEAGDYDAARGEARLTLRALKVRDAEPPPPLHLIRRRVELPEAAGDAPQDGPRTSCVIEPDRRSREDREAEQAAVIETATRDLDERVARLIIDRPDLATSQDALRIGLGCRKSAVTDSLARLVRSGWVRPRQRKEPYAVTATGRAALGKGQPS